MKPLYHSAPLTRRGFLKLGGVSLAAALLPAQPVFAQQETQLGRVLLGSIQIFEAPSFSARQVTNYWKDMVLPIVAQVAGESDDRNGPEWAQIGNLGYTHLSWLQPVQVNFQEPAEELVFTGSLAEVTVPFADVYEKPAEDSQRLYRYYYSTTHWIDQIHIDQQGKAWYRVMDDKFPDRERWVRANRLRVFPYAELAPISPDVPAEDKVLEVYLEEQRMAAFEAGEQVFEAKISTGDGSTNEQYHTPPGHFRVGLKRASQHMLPINRTFGNYDLPGVPWVSYFTQGGHAFHGAFWHNAFGRVRSHGCVNLTPDDARWVYVWSTPEMRPYNQLQYSETGGTRVDIF